MSNKFYLIDGVRIDLVEPDPSADVRFWSNKWLKIYDTAECRAELKRRAKLAREQQLRSFDA